ncbi:MAG: YIP1 family protein [Bacillota bacterium]
MSSMIPGLSEPAPISPWRALWLMMTDPVSTFQRLGTRPAILPAYLLHTVVGLVAIALAWSYTMNIVDEKMAANAAATPDMMPVMKMSAIVGGIIGGAATPWLVGLAVSLLALFIAQFQGGGVPFSSFYGMVGYARVPLAISILLGGLWVALVGKPLDISLAAVLSADASPTLKAALMMVNPFGLWYYALLAIGFATLMKKPATKGIPFAATLFVLSLLLAMAGGGLSAAFTPSM